MVYFAKWKIVLVAIVTILGIASAFPNFLSEEDAAELPGFLPSNQINLGLDLQGGSHLLLEVDVAAVLSQRREGLVDAIRDGMRRGTPRIGYRRLGVRGECVGFDLLRDDDLSRARQIVRDLDTNTFDPQLEINVDGLERYCLRYGNRSAGNSDLGCSAIHRNRSSPDRRTWHAGADHSAPGF